MMKNEIEFGKKVRVGNYIGLVVGINEKGNRVKVVYDTKSRNYYNVSIYEVNLSDVEELKSKLRKEGIKRGE